jgi:hypothetical protein
MLMTRIMNHIDLVLFAALVAFGWYVLACRPWGIGHDQAAAAGLAGVRIPRQTGHPFHAKLDTDSAANWTPIPAQTGH